MRRIFYGVPTTNPNAFGLAYEELDEKGNVVGLPATDVMPFDPANSSICLPLGPGNTPAYERWQLVNVATEDHNFHIHQVKFRVLSDDELTGTEIRKGIELDNVPLPHADGACGTNPPADLSNPIADWRAGLCTAHPITVEIPFAVAGKFVYHCHILEHEDGGMMAVIQVVPSTN
jgi:FtsP/CotA-like multicopper oxidase with cupredoxin domain